MGEPPEWWSSMQAARYLGVPWWELTKRSIWWRDKAIIAMNAENQAQDIINNSRR